MTSGIDSAEATTIAAADFTSPSDVTLSYSLYGLGQHGEGFGSSGAQSNSSLGYVFSLSAPTILSYSYDVLRDVDAGGYFGGDIAVYDSFFDEIFHVYINDAAPDNGSGSFLLGVGDYYLVGAGYTQVSQTGAGTASTSVTGAYSFSFQDSAVPEPSTWAMMFIGFGAIGFGMRRSREAQPKVQFAFG